MEEFTRQLEATLALAMQPDTAKVREATSTLEGQFYIHAQVFPALFHIIQHGSSLETRHMAAVESSKLCRTKWEPLDRSTKVQLRQSLLHFLPTEPNTNIQHQTARVLAQIAQIDYETLPWPELVGALKQLTTSQRVADREIGVYMVYSICDASEDVLADKRAELFQLFSYTLCDQESRQVRLNSLFAVGAIAQCIYAEDKALIKMFRSLMPVMQHVLRDTIEHGDDEGMTRRAFEVFTDFVLSEPALVSKHVGDLLQMMLQIAQTSALDEDYRNMALSFINVCVRFKSRKVQSLQLGSHLTMALMEIAAEEDTQDPNEDCPSRLALLCIDILSTSLPPSHVFEPLMRTLPAYAASTDAGHRKAALLALGVSVEGASDFISRILPNILPLVIHGLQDSQVVVQRAALMALGQLARELQEDIAKEHMTFMPLVFQLMSSQQIEVGKAACICLDALLEGLQPDDIKHYLPQLMQRLNELMASPALPTEVKLIIATAIGTAAQAAEEEFIPYFQDSFQVLVPYLQITEGEEEIDLRGVVTESISSIATAVGRETFNPYVSQTAALVYEGMKAGHSRLRECSFWFFAILAKVYKEECAAFLDMIMSGIFEVLEREEQNELGGDELNEDEEESDPDIDEDSIMNQIRMNSELAAEKEVAAEVLGVLYTNIKTAFEPYIERSINLLAKLLEHDDGDVRKAAANSLWRIIATMREASSPPWTMDDPNTAQLHPNVQKVADVVFSGCMGLLATEDERHVVIDVLNSMAETTKLCGPNVLGGGNNEATKNLCNVLLEILKRKHICQDDFLGAAADDEDEDALDADDMESAEEESALIDAACDVVIALAWTHGPSFADAFAVFFPEIVVYSKSKNITERALAVASIGEICIGLKSAVTPFTAQMKDIFMTGLMDGEVEIRSNSAYAMGLLCQYTQADLTGDYLTILQKLQPLLDDVKARNAIDNAVGCISRMIRANPSAVPLDHVLPVVFQRLPLSRDYQENTPLYEMIIKLYKDNNAVVMQLTETLMPVFASVLTAKDEQLVPDLKVQLLELVRALDVQFPGLVPVSSPLKQML